MTLTDPIGDMFARIRNGQMRSLGFLRVGKNFPVYLHPETKEEYALARKDAKVGSGHTGFVVDANPGITLEEDLYRRDLTINAIAEDQDGRLIDPFDGLADIKNRVLRHVSDAFICLLYTSDAADE